MLLPADSYIVVNKTIIKIRKGVLEYPRWVYIKQIKSVNK